MSDDVTANTHPTVPPNSIDPDLYELQQRYSAEHLRYHESIMRFRFLYAVCGLLLGVLCILGGIILFLYGVIGSTTWTAKLLGVGESKITDAAPGAVLFIVGLFTVMLTRFSHRSVGSFDVVRRRYRESGKLG